MFVPKNLPTFLMWPSSRRLRVFSFSWVPCGCMCTLPRWRSVLWCRGFMASLLNVWMVLLCSPLPPSPFFKRATKTLARRLRCKITFTAPPRESEREEKRKRQDSAFTHIVSLSFQRTFLYLQTQQILKVRFDSRRIRREVHPDLKADRMWSFEAGTMRHSQNLAWIFANLSLESFA